MVKGRYNNNANILQYRILFFLLLGIIFFAVGSCSPNPGGSPSAKPSMATASLPETSTNTAFHTITPTTTFTATSPTPKPGLQFLIDLQDTQSTGLVQQHEGTADTGTTTYVNALAAIAFTAEGEFGRARKIFDFFVSNPNPNPTVNEKCPGGYPQFWDAATGKPIVGFKQVDAAGTTVAEQKNDVWLGDNAWLLLSLKDYQQAGNDKRYEGLIQQLKNWFVCLQGKTPSPGIYAGFQFDGDFIRDSMNKAVKHAEGSLDAYGALRGLGVEQVRSSIKTWLDQNVWVPEGNCFNMGLDNKSNLPLDHVTMGSLGLRRENSNYQCILSFAEELLARTQDRYLIDAFDQNPRAGEQKDWYWQDQENEGCRLPSVAWDQMSDAKSLGITFPYAHELEIKYFCPSKKNGADSIWFRIFRNRDVHLEVTKSIQFSFWLKGDGSNNRLEVTLTNTTTEVYEYILYLTFVGWKKITVNYDDLKYGWAGDPNHVLTTIKEIAFATNNDSPNTITGEFWIGPIWFSDSGAPTLPSVNGFAAFQSDGNWLWIQGTAQMADAYCVADQKEKCKKYLDELSSLLSVSGGKGLPNYLYEGNNRPDPEVEATAWYIIASHGLNPFPS
jgi:Carbohydrate binding domain (family 11)